MFIHRLNKLVVLLVLTLWVVGCSNTSNQIASPSDTSEGETIIPSPTPVKISILTNNANLQNLSEWASRCEKNETGEPITELATMEPYKAVVLKYELKENKWTASQVFPTLINQTGEPKYLICVYATRVFVGNYYSSDDRTIPGYREDWKVTVQVLDTGVIYQSEILVGPEPYEERIFRETENPTEIWVGGPGDLASAVLRDKTSRLAGEASFTFPYGWGSFDFAPDGRSLYIPFENGFRKWDFATNTLFPLQFRETPTQCEGERAIRVSINGEYLITTCDALSGASTEVWKADTLQQTAKFDTFHSVDRQFELQEESRIISHNLEIETLDLSTGEVQTTPLDLDGSISWVSPEGKYAITHNSDTNDYKIWDLTEQKIIQSFEQGYVDQSLGLEPQVSRDGQLLLSVKRTAFMYMTLTIRDVQTLQPLLEVTNDNFNTFQVSPDGQVLAVLTDLQVDLIDLQNKSWLKTIPVTNGKVITFSPDSSAIALLAGRYSGTNFAAENVVVFSTGLNNFVNEATAEVEVTDPNFLLDTPTKPITIEEPSETPFLTINDGINLAQIEPTIVDLGYGRYSVGKYEFSSDDPADDIHYGDPIIFAGIEYSQGIFAHAPSRLVYNLGSNGYVEFDAVLGLVQKISCGDGVIFIVVLDGEEIYRSEPIYQWDEPVDIQLPITNGSELTLITDPGEKDDNSCDWAIWGDPRLR